MKQIARSPKQIGEALQRARKLQKLSQAEVGFRSGLRQATISSIEGGDAGTQLKTLTSVLATLGLELVIQPRESDGPFDLEEIF